MGSGGETKCSAPDLDMDVRRHGIHGSRFEMSG